MIYFWRKDVLSKNQSNKWYPLKIWMSFQYENENIQNDETMERSGREIGVFRQGHSKNNQKAGIELQRALLKMLEHRKKTFITCEQLLGVAGVRFHCLALFTTFDLGLFKNSHTHESIPESAFCLAILQEKKTVCDQWGDLSKWKLIRTWLTNSTYSKSIQGQDKASCSKLWASSSGNRRMLGMVILLLKLECVLPVFQPKTWKWNRRCCI